MQNEPASVLRQRMYDVLVQLAATPYLGATDEELRNHFSAPLRPIHARRFELMRMGFVGASACGRTTPWEDCAVVWTAVPGAVSPAYGPLSTPPEDRTGCDHDYATGHHYLRTTKAGFCMLSDTIFHPCADTIAAGQIGCWGPCGKTVGIYSYIHPLYGLSWALAEHQEED